MICNSKIIHQKWYLHQLSSKVQVSTITFFAQEKVKMLPSSSTSIWILIDIFHLPKKLFCFDMIYYLQKVFQISTPSRDFSRKSLFSQSDLWICFWKRSLEILGKILTAWLCVPLSNQFSTRVRIRNDFPQLVVYSKPAIWID